jgi:hypothetical protein
LGFAPLGVSHRSACRGLHRDSSYVLGDSADGGHPSRVHLRVSITEQLPDTLPCRDPFWGSCTFPRPDVRASGNPGYEFTSPGTHHYW